VIGSYGALSTVSSFPISFASNSRPSWSLSFNGAIKFCLCYMRIGANFGSWFGQIWKILNNVNKIYSRRSHVEGTPILAEASMSISCNLSKIFIYSPKVFLTYVWFSSNIASSLSTRSYISIITFFRSLSEFVFSWRVAAKNYRPPILDINSRLPTKFSERR